MSVATIRQRWKSGRHVGATKPVLRGYLRTVQLGRNWRSVPEDLVYSHVPGWWGGNKIWHGRWRARTAWKPLPQIFSVDIDQDYEQNGVASATIVIENIYMAEKEGPAGVFHAIERGYFSPFAGSAPGVRGLPKTAPQNEWFDVLSDKSSQIIILAGYGDEVEPIFEGLVNDCDMESRPDRITLTCRDPGQTLTDQQVFLNAKARHVPDPITFCDRLKADETDLVGSGAASNSEMQGHPARFVLDESEDTAWISEGHNSPDPGELPYVEIDLPHGRYATVAVHPRYEGLTAYVAVLARDANAPGTGGARKVNTGERYDDNSWINEGNGNVPGTSIPYVKKFNALRAKERQLAFPDAGYELGDGSKIRIYFTHLTGAEAVPAMFHAEGPAYYQKALNNNLPYAKPKPWFTDLGKADEEAFREWVSSENVPFDVNADITDYDMRGYWLAIIKPGGEWDGGHFPDNWKTPYDTTFSAESKYATADCPFHWRGELLVNTRNGRVIFSPLTRGYTAGVITMKGVKRTVKKEAVEKRWILVDDLADVVRTVFQWCGLNAWEVETTGVRLKTPTTFNRGHYLIDIINAASEQVGYVFYMKPRDFFDEEDLGKQGDIENGAGIAVWRQSNALRTGNGVRDAVEVIHEDQTLTGIDAKWTDEPLAFNIRVRGRRTEKKRRVKAVADAEPVTGPNRGVGRRLGADKTKRYMYVYQPPWSRGAFHAGQDGGDYRNGNIKKYEVHHDNKLSSIQECKIAALLIAYRMAMEAGQAQLEIPCMPSIFLDHQAALFDTGTGLSTRLYVASRQISYKGGDQGEFKMALSGPLLDLPDIKQVRKELVEVLRNSNRDPGLSRWESEHFGYIYRNKNF